MAAEISPCEEVSNVRHMHKKNSIIDGLIFPPNVTREVLEHFPKLPFRSGDVVVATYPKSGIGFDRVIFL
jgi:hypothetical protein